MNSALDIGIDTFPASMNQDADMWSWLQQFLAMDFDSKTGGTRWLVVGLISLSACLSSLSQVLVVAATLTAAVIVVVIVVVII